MIYTFFVCVDFVFSSRPCAPFVHIVAFFDSEFVWTKTNDIFHTINNGLNVSQFTHQQQQEQQQSKSQTVF